MSRAILVRKAGGPEVMRLEDHDPGAPGEGEIRLRQTAIGVNFVDTYQRTGSGAYRQPLPFVPGNEGAGVVIAVGSGVNDLRVGDRVAYSGIIGAYAEERLLRADRAVPLPDSVSDETAAAILLKGLTAWFLLRKTCAVGPNTVLLLHAAAGGVGQVLSQWAKALGACVIGTAGGAEKAALARGLGCDHVIDYRAEDFAARTREFTGGAGVDVVYDGVGRDTFEKSLDCLKPRGLMVSFGNASGPVSIDNLGILAGKGSLFVTRPTGAHYLAMRHELLDGARELFDMVQRGAIKVAPPRRFPLEAAADAHRALEGRGTTGSLILTP